MGRFDDATHVKHGGLGGRLRSLGEQLDQQRVLVLREALHVALLAWRRLGWRVGAGCDLRRDGSRRLPTGKHTCT